MENDFLESVKKFLEKPTNLSDSSLRLLELNPPPRRNYLISLGKPFVTDPDQLSDPSVLKEFKEIVEELVKFDDQEQAIKAKDLLENILLPLNKSLEFDHPEIFQEYFNLIVILKFITLSARSLKEVVDLIKTQIITVLTSKIKMKEKLQDVLDVYNDILLEGKVSEALSVALRDSKIRIGTVKIQPRGSEQEALPTISAWINDYHRYTMSLAGPGRVIGPMERVTYLNQSPNMKLVSKEERSQLLHIFELYDWLRFGDPNQVITLGSDIEHGQTALNKPTSKSVVNKQNVTDISSLHVTKSPNANHVDKSENVKALPLQTEPQRRSLPPPPLPTRRDEVSKINSGSQKFDIKNMKHPEFSPQFGSVSRPDFKTHSYPPKLNSNFAKTEESNPVIHGEEKKLVDNVQQSWEGKKEAKQYVPRTTSLNEQLYRSTLEELQKLHEQQFAKANPIPSKEQKPETAKPVSPTPPSQNSNNTSQQTGQNNRES